MKEKERVSAKKVRPSGFWLKVIVLIVLGVLTLVVWSPLSTVHRVSAGTLPLPPRPVFETPVPGPGVGPLRPVGGWIQLQAQGAADASRWSDVQWQDGMGVWHTVESWHGQFDQVQNGVGTKTWWVDRYTFGPTPFRWVVFDSSGKSVLVTSQVFNLPTQNQQTVVVPVTLPSK